MKNGIKVLFGIIGAALIFWSGGWAQERFNFGADLFNQNHLEEGLKRYMPTRMQWLALELERRNLFTLDKMENIGFYVSYTDFYGRLDADITYRYKLEYKKVKDAIEAVRANISMIAKEYGWDSWVRVQLTVNRSLFEKVGDFWYKREGIAPEIYEWKGNEQPKLLKF